MSSDFARYGWATLICLATAAIATSLLTYLDLTNVIMLFLLGVVAAARYLGRGPSVWAAFFSVACFDFLFVPPLYTFTVNDEQYLLTFAVMLVVALVIGQLTARLSREAHENAQRTKEAAALTRMAHELADTTDAAGVARVVIRELKGAIAVKAAFLMPERDGSLAVVDGMAGEHLPIAPLMASLAYQGTTCSDPAAAHPTTYVSVRSALRTHAVLVVSIDSHSAAFLSAHKQFLETVAALAALGLARLSAAAAAAHV